MNKADLDIKDQVAFEREGRVQVGRVIALGPRTATVQVWNTGDYEVAYAKLTLRKKKSKRKSPSKATRELRAMTGSSTAVAVKPKKSKQPTWAELGLPEEGLIDLGIPDWEGPAAPAPAPKKRKGKKAAPKKQTRKAAPKKGAGRKGKRALEPQSSAAMQEKIGKVLSSLLIRKSEDRKAVTAIAEKIIADEGFSEQAIQAAAVVHFGPREDAPAWMKKIDRQAVSKFYKKYRIRGGKVMSQADISRAGGKVKLPKMGRNETFADYTKKHWGGIEKFVYTIWPEFRLTTKKQKATLRAMPLSEAEKFIKAFERAYESKTQTHTVASAFEKAMEKVSGDTQEKARSKAERLHMIMQSHQAMENPAACSTRGRYAVLIRERGKEHCTFATDDRALANRAAKAMRKKGRNSFVADLGKLRKNPETYTKRTSGWTVRGLARELREAKQQIGGGVRLAAKLPNGKTIILHAGRYTGSKPNKDTGPWTHIRIAARPSLPRYYRKYEEGDWNDSDYEIVGTDGNAFTDEEAARKGYTWYGHGIYNWVPLHEVVALLNGTHKEPRRLPTISPDKLKWKHPRSNPSRKRKGKRRAANRRKLRVGQTVEWVNRQGRRDWGVVHDARGKDSTVMSSVTMRFEEHLNRNLYPISVPKPNPSQFTPKGERMYLHIRDSYAPRMGLAKAKEVAARTVYCRAQCAPGLIH
jgi:hypothetical protein